MRRPSPTRALASWRARWGGIAPLLIAEFIVWLGFGGLLPVLSLYFVDQGVDLATLGIVIAAWPAARLVGEPIFGWLADRTARIPLMVVGLVLAGVFTILHLAVAGPMAFVVMRALVGLSTAIYDPAARGYLTDSTPPERRGEAFGLYGAAQMGGLLLGPAIGAIGADRLGGIGFVFVFSGVAAVAAAIPIALMGREGGLRTRPAPQSSGRSSHLGRRGSRGVLRMGRWPRVEPPSSQRAPCGCSTAVSLPPWSSTPVAISRRGPMT